MPGNTVVLLDTDDGRQLVRKKCEDAGISMAVFEALVNAEIEQQGKMRKAGLWDEFDRVFDTALTEESV